MNSKRIIATCWTMLLAGSWIAAQSPSDSIQVAEFEAFAGDTIIVENDYGRVRILPWSNPRVELRARRIATRPEQIQNVEVVAQKSGKKIFVQSYFYAYEAESVYVDLMVPSFLNVVVWGANPAVEVSGLAGYTRIHTMTGFITAENLMASSSIVTESGNILFRSTMQPVGDIRLETIRGNIDCRVNEGLNLRGWFRAGGTIRWNQELELAQGSLEKQIGVGGPLIFASALEGDVTLHIDAGIQSQANIATQLETIETKSAPPVESRSSGRWEAGDSADEPLPTTRPRSEPPDLSSSRPGPTSTTPVVYTSGGEAAGGGTFNLKVNVDWVYLNASVRDRKTNRAIPGLRKSDFEVREDRALQQIDKFSSTEAPFNLLLLLDVSGSTKSYINMVKEASIDFTQQIKASDRVALATFNSDTSLRQDFTSDRQEMSRAIERIRPGGGTAFYDALDRCVNQYMKGVDGRKAIVVFTDGVDNQLTGDYSNGSQILFRDLYRRIQETDTLVYTIFLDTEAEHGRSSSTRSRGVGGILADIILGNPGGTSTRVPWGRNDPAYEEARRELEMIADQTGGRMYTPRGIQDLNRSFREIADDLRIQYTLGFSSTNPKMDGSWRELDVRIIGRSDVAVRARKGYYAGSSSDIPSRP